MSQSNINPEVLYVSKLHEEYFRLINHYYNVKRNTFFVRYFNINKSLSTIEEDVKSTFDKFNVNGIVYDCYDYTPLFYIAQLTNDYIEDNETAGHIFAGNITVSTYTIKKPALDDLIMFAYPPYNKKEIMRITNIRTSIGSMYSTPEVNAFELTLEYAPIKDVDKLKIKNNYVYSLTEEKNLKLDDYVLLIKYLEKIETLLEQLKSQFDYDNELYRYEDIYSYDENLKLYNHLCRLKSYKRYFEKALFPYGIYNTFNRYDNNFVYNSGAVSDILTYSGPINIFDMNIILDKFEEFLSSLSGY
jgi:hypothetical protein